MALEAKGSNPFIHLGNSTIGLSPSGKAQDFDSCSRWFKSSQPSQPFLAEMRAPAAGDKKTVGILAQSVEHLTFNQGVPGSNPGCLIGNKN